MHSPYGIAGEDRRELAIKLRFALASAIVSNYLQSNTVIFIALVALPSHPLFAITFFTSAPANRRCPHEDCFFGAWDSFEPEIRLVSDASGTCGRAWAFLPAAGSELLQEPPWACARIWGAKATSTIPTAWPLRRRGFVGLEAVVLLLLFIIFSIYLRKDKKGSFLDTHRQDFWSDTSPTRVRRSCLQSFPPTKKGGARGRFVTKIMKIFWVDTSVMLV